MVNFVDVNKITNIRCASVDLRTNCVESWLSQRGIAVNNAGT